jgi:alkylhydroperoxidase family enzyme
VRAGVTERFYEDIEGWRTSPEYSEPERLAIEFAERFALDHLAIDDALFARLGAAFTDAEVLDLAFCTARFLGFGRMTQVLGVDAACPLPHAPA